jgi:hypothetical protein
MELAMRFTKFMEIIRGAGSRLFRRRRGNLPVVVRRITIGPGGRRQAPPGEHIEDPEAVGGTDDGPLDDALADYMAPAHGEMRVTAFREVSQRGDITHQTDEWRRRNNAMMFNGVQTVAITSSALLAKPEELRCRCPACGKFDVIAGVCCRCGRAFCGACSRQLATPLGVLLLCPDDYRREVAQFDTWAAWDLAKNNSPEVKMLPERPFAASSGVVAQKKGKP